MVKYILLISCASLLLFTGCSNDNQEMSNKEKKALSAEVAKDFVKRKQNRELVVTSVNLPGNDDIDVLFVKGYYKDTKGLVDIMIEEGPDYDFKVASIGTDE